MKYTINMRRDFPFTQNPAFCEIEGEHIICNDVQLPGTIDASCRFNPHKVRAWLIGNTFGAVCMVFAPCGQNALDSAVDAGKLDAFKADDQTIENERFAYLGNASEQFDLSDFWMGEATFDPARDILLIVALARAAESGAGTLE